MAKTFLLVVRSRRSTLIPFGVNSMPAASRFRPETFGFRPAATSR